MRRAYWIGVRAAVLWLALASVACAGRLPEPSGWWMLDGNLNDASAIARHMDDTNLHGGMTYGAGKYFSGVVLDGVDDWFELGDDRTEGTVSLSLWVYPQSLTDQCFIGRQTNLRADIVLLGYWANQMKLLLRGQWVQSGVSMTANQWHHVGAAIADIGRGNSRVTLYLDGVQVAQEVLGVELGTMTDATSAWIVGTNRNLGASTDFFKGFVDEVRIYDDVLTSEHAGLIAGGDAPYDGAGTEVDPYVISSRYDLLWMHCDGDLYLDSFVLNDDIDLTGYRMDSAIIAPDVSTANDFQGPAFYGAFDGNGHSISNLSLWIRQGDQRYWYLGLFGRLGFGGVAEGLNMKNVQIGLSQVSGSMLRLYESGAIAGENMGTIRDCLVYLSVFADRNEGVGAITGNNTGSISGCVGAGLLAARTHVNSCGGIAGLNSGVITTSNSTLTTFNRGEQWYAGGLVGYNDGDIEQCRASGDIVYSEGDVNPDNQGGMIGGLVGRNSSNGTIRDSCSAGRVYGHSYTGGLVGYNGGVIERCYSSGIVTGVPGADAGGLCGGDVGTIADSFWDIRTSQTENSDGGTGLDTVAMRRRQTYADAGWDFENVWAIAEGLTYPLNRTEQLDICKPGAGFAEGDINRDCVVDLADLGLMAVDWLTDNRVGM